jgi:hypothetical protein
MSTEDLYEFQFHTRHNFELPTDETVRISPQILQVISEVDEVIYVVCVLFPTIMLRPIYSLWKNLSGALSSSHRQWMIVCL